MPLLRKGQVDRRDQPAEHLRRPVHRAATRRSCGSSRPPWRSAIENARLFEQERQYADTLETLAEIGREVSSILDLDALLTRIAQLTKRLIDYRTFGILLVNEATNELEMKLALQVRRAARRCRR